MFYVTSRGHDGSETCATIEDEILQNVPPDHQEAFAGEILCAMENKERRTSIDLDLPLDYWQTGIIPDNVKVYKVIGVIVHESENTTLGYSLPIFKDKDINDRLHRVRVTSQK